MELAFNFFLEHWMLSASFLVLLTLFVLNEFLNRSFGIIRVTPQQAVDKINHENAAVIDIRGKEGFEKGHLLDARHVPENELEKKVNQLKAFKQRPVIIVCANGTRSAHFGKKLKALGFQTVMQLTGGMTAWQQEGLPVHR